MEVARGLRKDTPTPDVIIVVVDASNLQRNLYLVSQLIELGRPLVVALNMMDVAERRGFTSRLRSWSGCWACRSCQWWKTSGGGLMS